MPAFETVATAEGALVASLSWSHTAGGSNRLGIVDSCTKLNEAETVTAVWGTGNTMTEVARVALSDVLTMLRRIAPPASAQTITLTYSGTVDSAAGASRNYTDADQTTPLGTAATATGTSLTPSATVTSASGELVVDTSGFDNDNFSAPGAGQTERYDFGSSVSMRGSDEAGAASVVMSHTLEGTANDWQIIGVSIKPAAAAGPSTGFASWASKGIQKPPPHYWKKRVIPYD